MSDAAQMSEGEHPANSHHPSTRTAPEHGEEVKKWAIVAFTVLGLASLVTIHANGGRVHFARKHTSFSFEVGQQRPSTDGTDKTPTPPQAQ